MLTKLLKLFRLDPQVDLHYRKSQAVHERMMQGHEELIKLSNQVKCKQCGKVCASKHGLKIHTKRMHS